MGLTKAEKIAKNIEKKLEKKRIAAETKKTRKREELEREITAHLLWKDNLNKAWRDAMLKIKVPVYRQQIEIMWHTLDRAYDKKDSMINHLVYLKEIANVQYQRALGNFCVSVDKIIKGYLSNLEAMCNQNDIKTAELLKFGRNEIAHYFEAHKDAEKHLQLVLFNSHYAADSLAWNTHGEYMVRIDEESCTYHEIYDSLRAILEGAYCFMWENYKTTLRSYVTKTAEKQKQLRLLRKKEQMMADIIAAQAKKLIARESVIRHLQVELLAYETGEKQAGFRDRRNRIRDACNRHKKYMNNGVDIDMKQIAMLIKASDDAVEWIKTAQRKCEKIQRIAGLCRKYESQREKVMPYGLGTPQEPIRTHVRMHPDDDPMIFSALASTCGLIRLGHRISNAELSKRALIREKTLLERENAFLERLLADQNEENVGLEVTKCTCANPVPLKKYFVPPSVVEGILEIKKFLR